LNNIQTFPSTILYKVPRKGNIYLLAFLFFLLDLVFLAENQKSGITIGKKQSNHFRLLLESRNQVIPSRISIDLWHREEQVRQGDAQSAVVLVP